MAPEDKTGVDLAALLGGLGGGADTQKNLQLLQILSLMNKDQKKGPAQGVGDILGEQGRRKAQMADSYAPGTKYEAGWEPGSIMDAMGAFLQELGGGAMTRDMSAGLLNPQALDDLGEGFGDAMAMGMQIRDSGDQTGPYDDLIAKLVQTLMPQDPAAAGAAGSKPGATGGLATPFMADARDVGGADGFAMAGDTPYAAGQGSTKTKGGSKKSSYGASIGGLGLNSDSAGGIMEMLGGLGNISNPLASIGPSMGVGQRGSGGATTNGGYAENTSGNMGADATAALVAQILQRANAPAAPVAGAGRKDWGSRTKDRQSKPLPGYMDGGAAVAPVSGTMIRVGERSPKDKKYATEEVVFAAPGTVVAPVPKGMENPSQEDALGLIMAQLAKESQREVAPEADPGHSDGKLQRAARGYVTSSASQGRQTAMGGLSSLLGQRMSHKNQHLDRLQRDTQMRINERQGNRGLDLQGARLNVDYDLGLRGLGQRRYETDVNSRDSRYSVDQSTRLGNRRIDVDAARNAEEFRNWAAERDLKRQLGMRGLDIDQQKANQDYQLNSAQMAFQQIMAGITGSALPGVRAGRTPMLGLLG